MKIIGFLVLVALMIFFFNLPKLLKYYKIKRHIRELQLLEHHQVFSHLYRNVDGFNISKEARKKRDAFEYLYGEIDFYSFIALLTLVPITNQTVFYDLGSGVGKAVIACAMVFPVRKSCGIELFTQLHLAALEQKKQLSQIEKYRTAADHIEFINFDFLNTDIQDATIVFINATAFISPLWEKIVKKLERLPDGVIVITTSKQIKSTLFTIEREVLIKVSWGTVTAFIQKRTSSNY